MPIDPEESRENPYESSRAKSLGTGFSVGCLVTSIALPVVFLMRCFVWWSSGYVEIVGVSFSPHALWKVPLAVLFLALVGLVTYRIATRRRG